MSWYSATTLYVADKINYGLYLKLGGQLRHAVLVLTVLLVAEGKLLHLQIKSIN